MKNIIKNKLSANIFSLVTLKGADYILNFVMLPFLMRMLGAEKYGAIIFMQSIVQYMVICVDYGYNLTAPRDIARASNKKEIAEIFSNVMAAKILIMIATIIFSMLLIIFLWRANFLQEFDIKLFFATIPMILGNILFPVWFFQGIQEMKYITLSSVISRLIILILMLLTIKNAGDYIFAALLQSSMMLVSGILSMIIIFRRYKYIIVMPEMKKVRENLKEGWEIFISTVAINAYTTTNIVILGVMTNDLAVGFFSAANKIIDSIKGLQGAISQAVYPHISEKIKESKKIALVFIKKFAKIYISLFIIISMTLMIFAEPITKILFGTVFDETVHILMIIAWLPAIISVSNICGIQIMLNFGLQKEFSRVLILAAVIDLIIVIPLTQNYGNLGISWTMIIVEIIVSFVMAYKIRKIIRQKI